MYTQSEIFVKVVDVGKNYEDKEHLFKTYMRRLFLSIKIWNFQIFTCCTLQNLHSINWKLWRKLLIIFFVTLIYNHRTNARKKEKYVKMSFHKNRRNLKVLHWNERARKNTEIYFQCRTHSGFPLLIPKFGHPRFFFSFQLCWRQSSSLFCPLWIYCARLALNLRVHIP